MLIITNLLCPSVFFIWSNFPQSGAKYRGHLGRVDAAKIHLGQWRVSLGHPLQVFGQGFGVVEVFDDTLHSAQEEHDQLLKVLVYSQLAVTLVPAFQMKC